MARCAAVSLFRNGASRGEELDVLRRWAGHQHNELRARSITPPFRFRSSRFLYTATARKRKDIVSCYILYILFKVHAMQHTFFIYNPPLSERVPFQT
jgi:hypothetical protein